MKLLTPHQISEIDQKTVSQYGIPSVLLMEHAAYSVFSYLKEVCKEKNILIICGPGNNGGDGLALARQLRNWSLSKSDVIMATSSEKLTSDGKIYYEICKKLEINLLQMTDENEKEVFEKIHTADIIVDALFGTGLSRPVEGKFKRIIDHINKSDAKVISIDIPSGIDGLTGKVQNVAVQADVTITFMVPKVGLCLYPGVLYAGEIKVMDIGIPKQLINEDESRIFSIEKEEMQKLLPKRPMRSNKGTFGKVLTIGGSLGMSGAISLASMAAYKAGCGTVTTVVPRCILEIVQQKLTEVMAIGLDDLEVHFSEAAVERLKAILPHYQTVAIGPGMGRSKETLSLLLEVLKTEQACVIDADALYFIPEVLEVLKKREAPTILTPHPGEMARMTGAKIEDILADPLKYAMDFSKKFSVVTVLKLEKTVIADRTGDIYINRYGNSGLAKGGSGDTLTGIITGLLAQHISPIDAARLGVYLQTRAADLAKDSLSEYSFMASDVIHFLGKAFLELT